MKAVFFALAVASSVAAIDLDGIPTCAIPCLQEAIPKVGCGLDDTACQCRTETQSNLVSVVAPCLLKECSSDDLTKAQEAAGAACAAYSASAVATATPTGKTATTKKAGVVSTTTTPDFYASTPVSNGTQTTATKKTKTGSSSETETGASGSDSTATGSSSVPTSTDNAASVAGPAFGAMVAVLAAAFAL